MKRTPGHGRETRPGVRFASTAGCAVLAVSLGAASAFARPERGAAPAPVDAAVWDAVDGGPTTFLVRLHPPESTEKVAGPARRQAGAAVAGTLRATGLARLAVLDATLAELTRSGHVQAVTRFPASGVAAVRGDATAVADLAALPEVAEVRPDAWRRLVGGASASSLGRPGTHVTADGADDVWRRLGVTGETAVVAVIDTGADWSHPQLARAYRGRDGAHDYAWWDATGVGADRPVDVHGHGTVVTGIVVGDDGDVASGLAPGAEWIAVRAFDRSGSARDSWLLAAAEWVLAPTDRHGANARPEMAPDIVNASWVLENGADPLYRPVLAAWRAAGILPVFAAGNDERALGPLGSILAPASYPEAIGVGGAHMDGTPWPLSLGGPSSYGGVAPDLMAPVAVWGPAVGGGLTSLVGTSAAAPQVSATAALMLAANPGLTPDDLEALLGRSARDAPPPGPDDRFGHGILDAFAAVRLALDAGRIAGRVSDIDGALVPASLTLNAGGAAPVVVDAPDGTFDAAVAAGDWQVHVQAVGYDAAARDVRITPQIATRLEQTLTVARTWEVAGAATDGRGQPAPGARIAAFPVGHCTFADGCGPMPHAETIAGADGRYALALPEGEFRLLASAPRRRAATATVGVPMSTTTDLDFALAAAPSIAFVDADSDLEERISPYIVAALREAGYDADPWVVDRALGSDWAPFGYDLVVWAHSAGSPGRLDQRLGSRAATDALTQFAQRGGRLLVSGQNVATLDAAGASPAPAAPEFARDVLRVRHVSPQAAGTRVEGQGYFGGLDLSLDLPLGYRWGRLLNPDVVAESSEPGDPVHTVLTYGDGAGAAVASAGPSGRRMFLAFGPEGAGPPQARAALLGRAVEWLTAPDISLEVVPPRAEPAQDVRIEILAQGAFADTDAQVDVVLPPGLAPTGLFEGLGPAPGGATWEGKLQAGRTLPLAMTARALPGFSGAVAQQVVARLRADAVMREAVAVFQPLAPGFEGTTLRVAPKRLREGDVTTLVLELANRSAFDAATQAAVVLPASLAPDPASVAATDGDARVSDSSLHWSGVLGADPVTVTLRLRAVGAAALESLRATVSGGAVAFTSPVALVRIGGPDLAGELVPSALEVEPGDVVTTTLRVANRGAAAARVLATVHAPVTMQPLAPPRWEGDVPAGGETVVPFGFQVTSVGPTGLFTVTAAMSDGLDPPATYPAYAVMRFRAPDLSGSSLEVEAAAPVSGGLVHGTLTLVNSGDAPAVVAAQLALPPTLSLEPATLRATTGSARAEASGVRWDAQVPAGGRETLTYDALVARSLRPNSVVAVTAEIASVADPAAASKRLVATILANRLDLSGSTLEAAPRQRAAGGSVAFTMTVRPTGDVDARDAQIAIRLPPSMVVDPETLRGGVALDASLDTLVWRGRLPIGVPHRFHWTATLDGRLDVGARAITRGVIAAPGVEDLDLAAVVRVTASDFTGSSKAMSPAVAGRGQLVRILLRAVNAGADAVDATLTDALPEGLAYIPGSASASYGHPEWDDPSRSLRWRGTIPAHGAAEIRLTARMESTERVINVLQLSDDNGTRLAAWAEVAPRRATVFLPALARP